MNILEFKSIKLKLKILFYFFLRESQYLEHRNTTHQVKAIAIGIFAADPR